MSRIVPPLSYRFLLLRGGKLLKQPELNLRAEKGGLGESSPNSRATRAELPVMFPQAIKIFSLPKRICLDLEGGRSPRYGGIGSGTVSRRGSRGGFPHRVGEMSRSDKRGRAACGAAPRGRVQGRFPRGAGEMSRSDKGGRPACGRRPRLGRRPRYGRRCQMSVLYWRMVRSLEKGPALAMFIRHLRAKASRSCA